MKYVELIPVGIFALAVIMAFITGYFLCKMKKEDVTNDDVDYRESERPFIDNH